MKIVKLKVWGFISITSLMAGFLAGAIFQSINLLFVFSIGLLFGMFLQANFKKIFKSLETNFSNKERHVRRLEEISDLE